VRKTREIKREGSRNFVKNFHPEDRSRIAQKLIGKLVLKTSAKSLLL